MSLEPRKYSERLGVLDADQLQAACDEFGLGTITDAESPVGGLFGQNVIMTTSGGRFVLRGCPHGHVQLTKERVVAKFIHDNSSLPAPWPYQVSEDTQIFGWTFAVMPCLPGEAGTSLWDASDDAGQHAIAIATGEALARMHEASASFFGPYDAQVDGFIEMDDFPDWLLYRLEFEREQCRSVQALSTESELYIDRLIEECAEALEVPFTPALVHHDFKYGNLAFERRGSGFEASGVFDLMEAYLADGEEDIVRMLWSVDGPKRQAFFDAYTSERPLRDGAAERLALYALADWMVIFGYGRRHGTWFGDTTFMESVTPVIRNARAIAG